MIRSAIAALAIAAASVIVAVGPADAHPDAGKPIKLTGTVTSSAPTTTVRLTKGSARAGSMSYRCDEGRSALTCTGRATIQGLGQRLRLRVSWSCPPSKSCDKVGTGTLTGKHGKVATLQLRAEVSKAVSVGHSWPLVVTPV